MKRLVTLAALAAFLTCGFAYGEEPGPNYDHLKPLEWMIGEWVLESTLDEDVPNIGEAGDQFDLSIKWSWGLRRNIINEQMTVLVNDKVKWTSKAIKGWDAEKEQIVSTGFDSSGGHGNSIVTYTKDSFKSRTERCHRKGFPEGQRSVSSESTKIQSVAKRRTLRKVEKRNQASPTWN